jgi:hypothetical protein
VNQVLVLLTIIACLAGRARAAVELVYFAESPRGLHNFDTATGLSTLRVAMTGTERFFAMARCSRFGRALVSFTR